MTRVAGPSLPVRGSCTATRSALTAAWRSRDRVTSHQSLLSYTFIAVDPCLQNSADIQHQEHNNICLILSGSPVDLEGLFKCQQNFSVNILVSRDRVVMQYSMYAVSEKWHCLSLEIANPGFKSQNLLLNSHTWAFLPPNITSEFDKFLGTFLSCHLHRYS